MHSQAAFSDARLENWFGKAYHDRGLNRLRDGASRRKGCVNRGKNTHTRRRIRWHHDGRHIAEKASLQ